MRKGTDAEQLRLQAETEGLILQSPDAEEARFVFELKAGPIIIAAHPQVARQLLLLAESICAPDRGEARELSRLIARRDELEDDDAVIRVTWQHAARAHADAPEEYDRKEWVQFGEWLKDQFLLEDAIAKMDEGVPV